MQVDENGKEIKTALVIVVEKTDDGNEEVFWHFPDTVEPYFLIGVLEDIKQRLLFENMEEHPEEEFKE